jgi:hypothetical protein
MPLVLNRAAVGHTLYAWAGVAGLSLALHITVLATASAWARPSGASWDRGTQPKEVIRITLATLPTADGGALRRFDTPLASPNAYSAAPLAFDAAATIAPVALEMPPSVAALTPPLPDPADAYHSVGELTKRPMLITPIELLFNAPASTNRPGRMRIRLLISPHGRIDEVVIDNSSLTSLLRDEVIARFANAIYEPGEIDGKPVASQVTIEIRS